jgi:hypothetical protein
MQLRFVSSSTALTNGSNESKLGLCDSASSDMSRSLASCWYSRRVRDMKIEPPSPQGWIVRTCGP